jgi:uncharacterized protein YndB with AHSA1/START domain
MTALGWIAAGAGAAAVGAIAWGLSLPAETSAARTATIAAPPEKVFALVATPEGQTAWRGDVAAVTVEDGGRRWTETTRGGVDIGFEEVAREPGVFYALRFRSAQGFSGSWEGRFAADPGGTALTVVETVRTEGLIPRMMARLFAPPDAHVDRYLADLKRAAEGG